MRGFKAELDGPRERMRGLGFSYDGIAAEVSRRYQLRPREAYRLAWGLAQTQAAERFNDCAAREEDRPAGPGGRTRKVTKAPAEPPRTRPSGTDDLSYGQLAAARKAVRHLLDSGVLTPAERGTLTGVVQRISAAIDARPVDLGGAHQRWPGWRFSLEGEELVARSTDGLCTLRADSPEALEAEVRREEQRWASVRAFAANPAWRTPGD